MLVQAQRLFIILCLVLLCGFGDKINCFLQEMQGYKEQKQVSDGLGVKI